MINNPMTDFHMTYQQTLFGLFVFVFLLNLGGCTMLGPDFHAPEARMPKHWSEEDSGLFKRPSREDSVAWWKEFNDPMLDELIELAYHQNLTLRSGALRIIEARAQLGLVKGSLYPQVQEMNGDLVTIGTTGPADDRYYNAASLGFDVGWEIDFWGKFRRSIESADANLLASAADYDDILVSLTAEVARTYVNIRTLEERINLAERNAELQENSLKLVNLQFEAGVVTELDVLQAKTLLSSTLATIPNFRATLATYRNGLAVLLGTVPEDLSWILRSGSGIPEISTQIGLGAPAELLRRRPDIRRAELQAAAQSAQIGIARTELFPSFTLFGSLGWSSSGRGNNSLGDIFDSTSFSYTFGPAFKWSIFNYGRLKNQVRVQDARFEQLLVNYQNNVLNAAREVEDAMQSLGEAHLEVDLLGQGVATSKRSTELSMLQYEEGLADYQRVLDSTRSLTQKQDQYAQTKGKIATLTISLYKAFGGGWQVREGENYLPPETREQMTERTDWGTLLNDITDSGE